MNNPELGKLITTDARRDAIHIAIAPVIAGHDLAPGQRVGFAIGSTEIVRVCDNPIGIVDPFLKEVVNKGERFYLFLLPNTIMSLRHEWVHPAFDSESIVASNKSESIAWINDWADQLQQNPKSLMEAAARWIEFEDYTYDNSESYKHVDYDKWPEFWRHYEIVTGTKPKSDTDTFFTCSC